MKKASLAANVSASWWRVLCVFGTSEKEAAMHFRCLFVSTWEVDKRWPDEKACRV